MTYELSQEVESRVQAQIAAGAYSDREDVLRDAMDALESRNADMAAIAAGIDDERGGRVKPLTEVDRAMRERYGISEDSARCFRSQRS